jgi:hypothetical protein
MRAEQVVILQLINTFFFIEIQKLSSSGRSAWAVRRSDVSKTSF